MPLLQPGDLFPSLTVATPGGDSLVLPEAFDGDYGVVLLFRGSWCPFCNGQLRAFQKAREELAQTRTSVVALSVDDEAATAALIFKHDLEFPVGHSADALAVAELTGAFVNPDPLFLQSTGFVLAPDGRVVVSVYSSGAIGRLLPHDVAGLVSYDRQSRITAAATS